MRLATRRLVAITLTLMVIVTAPECRAAQDETIVDKIKHLFVKPTPTPTPKPRRKTPKRKGSPTALPTPTPSVSAEAPPGATAVPSESAAAAPEATAAVALSQTESPTAARAVGMQTPTASATASPRRGRGRSQYLEPVRPIAPGPRAKVRASVTPPPATSPPETAPPTTRTESPVISPVPTAATASPAAAAASPSATGLTKGTHVPNATISPSDVVGYDANPPEIRRIVDMSLNLTKQNLAYKYGSADPANGGMDCSGFIYYVLSQSGVKEVPRDAREQYIWVRKAGNFQAVLAHRDDTFELDALKPGDLLFWAGTYSISRDPAITHTMIYLGRERATKQRVMVGASDGRTYRGQQRFGVSIFDFKVGPITPKQEGLSPVFVGYGRIPGLGGP